MDMKILAAVLTTLAAVFLVMNAGETPAETSGPGLGALIPAFLSPEPPQPQTRIEADIQIRTENTTMNLNGDLQVEGLTQYISDQVDIKSNQEIEFQNFQGTVFIGNQSRIDGKAEGFTSKGVQVAKNFKLQENINNSKITLEEVKRASLDLKAADIQLDALNSSTSISETNTTVKIESFSGNMTVTPENMSIGLQGNITNVEAGQTSFGG